MILKKTSKKLYDLVMDNNFTATHDGRIDSDQAYAMACVHILNPNKKIIRARNREEFTQASSFFDVTGKYNPDMGHVDHHSHKGQIGFRNNEDEYSAAGGAWIHLGEFIIGNLWNQYESNYESEELSNYKKSEKNKIFSEIYDSIDQKIFEPIDASDSVSQVLLHNQIGTIPSAISMIQGMNEKDNLRLFDIVVNFATEHLKGAINERLVHYDIKKRIKNHYVGNDLDKKLIIFDSDDLYEKYANLYFSEAKALIRKKGDAYAAYVVQDIEGNDLMKFNVDENEIKKYSDEGIFFIHPRGFLARGNTVEALRYFVKNNIDKYEKNK